MQFGQYIKEQRKTLGISSRKLSEKVGKSSSYISSIENGHYKPDFEMAYTILRELRVEISPVKISSFLESLGIEVSPVFGTRLLIKHHQELNKCRDTNLDTTNKKEPNYQMFYETRQEELIERLNNIVEQIEDDISNYPPDYEDCEEDPTFESLDKFLTTFTTLMLDSEIEVFNKFHELMELPLQKLNPSQFQQINDYVKSILEYEYVYESGLNSKTQKFPHYRVKYKEKINKPCSTL